MFPKHSAEVLSGFPKGRKAVICFMEKIHMLDKLQSGRHPVNPVQGRIRRETTATILLEGHD